MESANQGPKFDLSIMVEEINKAFLTEDQGPKDKRNFKPIKLSNGTVILKPYYKPPCEKPWLAEPQQKGEVIWEVKGFYDPRKTF